MYLVILALCLKTCVKIPLPRQAATAMLSLPFPRSPSRPLALFPRRRVPFWRRKPEPRERLSSILCGAYVLLELHSITTRARPDMVDLLNITDTAGWNRCVPMPGSGVRLEAPRLRRVRSVTTNSSAQIQKVVPAPCTKRLLSAHCIDARRVAAEATCSSPPLWPGS
jgi:hypothetical protein